MSQQREKRAFYLNGFIVVFIELVLLGIASWLLFTALGNGNGASNIVIPIIIFLVIVVLPFGFVVIQPNQCSVLTFLGKYTGTVRESGFFWVNPLAMKHKVSLRVRNFNSGKLKVNDARGNPIEIGAVVVWRVVDSAKAIFDVDNYEQFVAIQSETAIRALASRYPYDSHDNAIPSLRSIPEEVADEMKRHVQERLQVAGVEVMEARISHLAYAQEIAQAMLRRQQAEAVVAAREKIVEGAVGMVEMALTRIEDQQMVELDEERKATMVNNLLVALVAEGDAQPVLNTGTLYT